MHFTERVTIASKPNAQHLLAIVWYPQVAMLRARPERQPDCKQHLSAQAASVHYLAPLAVWPC